MRSVKVQTSKGIIFFVHTYKWRNVGDLVKAGQQICQIAPENVSKVPPHLHIYQENGKVRDLILADNDMKKDDHVEWARATNIRQGPALSFKVNVTASKEAVAVISRAGTWEADGYTWKFVHHPDFQGYAVQKNMLKTSRAGNDV